MPPISDEDQSVNQRNPAERIERERLSRAIGRTEIDADNIDDGVNDPGDYPSQGSTGGDSGERERSLFSGGFGNKKSGGRSGGGSDGRTDYGPSAMDDINNRIGSGYKEEGQNSRWSRLFGKGSSKRKKRIALITAVAGGGATLGILGFLALMPLRLETMITNLDNRFSAASNQAMEDTSSKFFNRWVARNIMPNLLKGTCRSTASAGCVSVDPDTGPIGKMYNGWRQGRLEQTLAKKYDIVLGRQGNRLYINFPQGNASITRSDAERLINGQTDLFELASENSRNHNLRVSRAEIRQTFKDALKEETLMRRTYDRYKLGKLIEKKYGVRRCTILCNARDNFKDKTEDKKLFAKSVFIQRVVEPLSENYAFMFQCILTGGQGCSTSLQDASSGDNERHTEAEQNIRSQLDRLAAKIGPDSVEKLVASSKSISEKGMARHITESIVRKLISSVAGEAAGQAGGKLAADSVPFAGWVLLFAQLADAAKNIGPLIKYTAYTMHAAAAVQTYSMFASSVAEMHNGHIDPEMYGTLNTALSSNLTGASEDQSDASKTPLYQYYNETGQPKAITTASLTGTAAAATSVTTNKPDPGYTCNDGKTVPKGKLVCKEEELNRGNDTANYISDTIKEGLAGTLFGEQFLSALSWISGLLGSLIDATHISDAINAYCSFNPICRGARDHIQELAPAIMQQIMDKLVKSPITENMSGGRLYDMTAAGADIVHNESCQTLLGCAQISDQQAMAIQDQYLQSQKEEFARQPFFARMFSTNTPYSLVSRLAVSMPGSYSSASTSLASFVSSPLDTVGSLFSNVSSVVADNQPAIAAPAGQKDPFGVPQSGYTNFPDDPADYWQKNCVTGPMARYDETTNTLDVSDWLNKQQQDPDTGQAVAKESNPCLLIHTTIVSAGGAFDPSLLPPGAITDDATSGGSTFRIATFNVFHGITSDWEARLQRSTDVLIRDNIEIAGLQELRENQMRRFMKPDMGGNVYDIYPSTFKSAGQGSVSVNSIIWNKTRFSLVSAKEINFLYFNSKTQKYPEIKLRDNETGQEFYVLNIHHPAHPENAELRYKDALANAEHLKELNKEGLPIFFTGDFNSGYSVRTEGNTTYQGKRENLTYCILTRDGTMWDAYDAWQNKSGECPTTSGNDNTVDHIFLDKSTRVTKYFKEQGGRERNGSDVHDTIIADVEIPSSGANVGGDSFTVGTYNLKHEIAHGGACIENACAQERSQKQANIILGKADNPAFDIVGTQEDSIPQHERFKTMLVGYGYFPEQVDKNQGNAIYWNGAKFTKIDSGYIDTIDNVSQPFKRPWVALRNSGGKKIYVMSVHAPNNRYGTAADRTRVARDAYNWARSVSSQADMIIVMGDFNEQLSVSSSNSVYCTLTQGSVLQNAKDMIAGASPDKTCPNKQASSIDQIYISPKNGISASGWNHPGQQGIYQDASDHSPTYVKVSFPGQSTETGTTSGVGKGYVGNKGFGGGWCTDYVKWVLRNHTNKYNGQSLGDGKDVASNLGRLFGYTVNHTPAIHAVVSFPGPPYGNVGTRYAGHVAIVSEIFPNGDIMVEESNYDVTMNYGTHRVSASEAKRLTYAHTEEGWH